MTRYIVRKVAVAAAVILLAIALPVAAAAATSAAHPHRSGSCRAQGDFAVCTASGNEWHPKSIHVHVSAVPGQKVDVAWDVVCSKGSGAGSKSGNFTARTSVNRKIAHPYTQPGSCSVAATGQLDNGGNKIHVWVTYWRWTNSRPAPPAPSCHPKTSSGHCYEPGEFCPAADHGLKGVAGDGKMIKCENENGWRWVAA
jgi:hypothetical protein